MRKSGEEGLHSDGITGIPSVGDSGANGANATTVADEAVYNAKLEQLKQFKEPLKLLMERNRIDGVSHRQMFDRLLEVIQGQRKVDEKLLDKLLMNGEKIFQKKLCHPLLEAVTAIVTHKEPFRPLPDPWAATAKFAIRVPDDLRAIADASSDEESGPLTDGAIEPLASSHTNADDSTVPANVSTSRIAVQCENNDVIYLSCEASRELIAVNARFEEDARPLTGKCEVVEVVVDSQQMFVPPLRLAIPVDYPHRPARLIQDPIVGEIGARLQSMLDRRMRVLANAGSIREMVIAWNHALEQLASGDVHKAREGEDGRWGRKRHWEEEASAKMES